MGKITTGAMLLAVLGVAANASAQPRALSADEITRSTQSAMIDVGSATANNAATARTRSGASRTLRTTPRIGHQLLLTERRPGNKGDPARLADVYIYNYSTESLLHRVVDTQTDRVVFRASSRGQQLPLTAQESQRAIEALFADTTARTTVRKEYERITGSPLNDLSTVKYKAVVFIANATANTANINCGTIRCAQILLYTAGEQIAIDLRPVVRLADDSVISVDFVSIPGHTH